MPRWSLEEEQALAEVRRRAKNLLEKTTPYPDGDRRILRFLRGKQLNVDESSKMYIAFLQWRLDNNIDSIRNEILNNNKRSPFDFPHGRTIIDLAPQIIITSNATDRKGQPLAMECYDFVPREVFKAVTKDDYLLFLTYCLEYRALVMEQLSHEAELKVKAEQESTPEKRPHPPYGQILLDFTIRDMKGLSLAHIGSEGRALVSAALTVGLANYPEYLGKCVFVNTPWIFHSMWFFIKTFLDEFTLAKISLLGHTFMDELEKDISYTHIPSRLGGGFSMYNEPFDFDLSPGGPFYLDDTNRNKGVSSGFMSTPAKSPLKLTASSLNTPSSSLNRVKSATTVPTVGPQEHALLDNGNLVHWLVFVVVYMHILSLGRVDLLCIGIGVPCFIWWLLR
eukprot:gene27185-32845_t